MKCHSRDLKMQIFMYCLVQFWRFKIFDLVKGGYLGELSMDPNSQSILHLLSFLIPSIPDFLKFWVLVKSRCFAMTHFLLCSSEGSNVFSFVCVLNLFIFSTVFFIVWWSMQNSFDISKVEITTYNNFFVFQHLLALSHYPCFSIYDIQNEK